MYEMITSETYEMIIPNKLFLYVTFEGQNKRNNFVYFLDT